MIQVFIVDDHPMVVEGLSTMLQSIAEIEVVGVAFNANSCLGYFVNQKADVILMDINLPDKSGIDLCLEIKRRIPTAKILALTNFEQRIYWEKMKQNGASGYLLKNTSVDELLEAIQTVYSGGEYWKDFPKGDTKNNVMLTRREVEVLGLISEGLTNQEIADKIFVSTSTVDSHRKNLLSKLQAKNTAALVNYAMKNKII